MRIARWSLVACVLASCSAPAPEASQDAPAFDDPAPRGEKPSPISDAGSSDEALPKLVPVAHERELRGAWISTVYNGTWPSSSSLTPGAAKAELRAMFDALAAAKMNAVFLQVRSECDALYPSNLEPFSRFLTGTMGKDPTWDPLAFAVEEAHARGLELHAWINPYRALTSSSVTVPASHVTKARPSLVVPWGNQRWLNPGRPEVRTYTSSIVQDVLSRYDVDGIHFDDYFYPYPLAQTSFPDDDLFAAYVSSGGTLDKLAWRRSNVDALVRDIGTLVASTHPDVRFGISPFGIYRPGVPDGVTGLDAYNVLACDPVRWMNEGWVDYVMPQLYWSTTKAERPFGKLAAWWASLSKEGRSVFAGHDATQLGPNGFSRAELEAQIALARGERSKGMRGSVLFTAKAIADDALGIRTALSTGLWAEPASTPPTAQVAVQGVTLAPPRIQQQGATLQASAPAGVRPRSYAVYALKDPKLPPTLRRIVPASATASTSWTLEQGSWAVSVIDRRGAESPGVVVDVR